LPMRGVFGSFDDLVFGAILIFVMLLAPGSSPLDLLREKARKAPKGGT